MNLKVGTEITAETIFEEVVTGDVTSILENSVVIENEVGRHVVKRETLKKLGYKIDKYIRPNHKAIQITPKTKGE